MGFPTVFVRLTGCPLRCQYCDTAYAFHGGEWLSIDDVLARVARVRAALRVRHRRRTAGAEELPAAADRACAMPTTACRSRPAAPCRWRVWIARVIRVVDVKTPGSGEERRNRYDDLALLRPEEQIKFVICDRADYEWSRAQGRRRSDSPRAAACCSRPAPSNCRRAQLADWILADRLPVRFQLQLHKVLWGNVPGK